MTVESLKLNRQDTKTIPKDWNIDNFGKNLDIFAGLGFKKSEYVEYGIKLLRIDNVSYGNITWESIACLPKEYSQKYPKLVLQEGDILLALNRPITNGKLKMAILQKNDVPCILYQRVGKIVFCNKVYDKNFTYFLLQKHIKKFVEDSYVGSDQPFISTVKLKKCKLPFPNNPKEQQAIAQALSDIERLIKKLGKFIEKKKNIKQGAMQELLIGKRRLPGFTGKWESKEFVDMINSFSSGATPYRGKPEYYKGQIRWITSGELNYNHITDTIEKISENARKNTNLILHPKGTFLIAITGLEVETTRGRCAIVGKPSTTNQSCMALYPKDDLSLEFLFHYYRLKGTELALKYCQGTKQQSYTAGIVKILPILIPPTKEEQIAIGKMLNDMDTEIKELEKKRDKYLMIKNGMMQKLLTGEIRLV